MSVMYGKGAEKRRHDDALRHDEEVIGSLCSLGDSSPHESMENWVDEKRQRREIANSNERRRMQSINSGFQSLRTLLPQCEGEKLSKAAILQQTTEYIYQLEQEKSRLVAQNCQLKRLLGPMKKDLLDNNVLPLSPETINEVTVGGADDPFLPSANKKSQMQQGPADKEKKKGVLSGEAYSRAVDRLRKEVNESKSLLEAERKLRLKLEEQIHALEAQLQLQIDVPEADTSEELTAHILGRKPNQPPKMFKMDTHDEDSDLLSVARATSGSSSSTNNQKWKKSSASSVSNSNARRNVITSSSSVSVISRRDSAASPSSSNDQAVQYLNAQNSMLTSLPAHLVLDDRPSSQTGSLLEAAMMAEPKVEVELASRVPSPALSLTMAGPSSPSAGSGHHQLPVLSFQLPPHLAHLSHLSHSSDGSTSPSSIVLASTGGEEVTFVDIDTPFVTDSKSYLAATSRQNLETIVEAIRHLEGDHLFNDDASGSGRGKSQVVEVEIDTGEGEAIGCSLVVTSAQDESEIDDQDTGLEMTLPEDQEVGEMITVSSEIQDHDNDCGEHILVEAANEEVVTSSNSDIIIVKRV